MGLKSNKKVSNSSINRIVPNGNCLSFYKSEKTQTNSPLLSSSNIVSIAILAHSSWQYNFSYFAASASVGEVITTFKSGKARLVYLAIKKSIRDLPVLVGCSIKTNWFLQTKILNIITYQYGLGSQPIQEAMCSIYSTNFMKFLSSISILFSSQNLVYTFKTSFFYLYLASFFNL